MTLDASLYAPEQLESHRRELTGYCYRMLGSGFEADDAVQETMLRAWKAVDGFEGRSGLRSWLYRIATNVCLDMLRSRKRRARPMDLGPARSPEQAHLGSARPEHVWISPVADARVMPLDADPAEIAAVRDTIRLAFVAALQHLPARQRAVLILSEVLRWQSSEVAELLGTSVAAVNSALQRARATMAAVNTDGESSPVDTEQSALIARYVDAFERYDVSMLVTLLHDDAIQSMPPLDLWIRGSTDIGRFLLGPGRECEGSLLVPTEANGCFAFGQYRIDSKGGHAPWALQVIETSRGRIAAIHAFLDVEPLFAMFGLPPHLDQ